MVWVILGAVFLAAVGFGYVLLARRRAKTGSSTMTRTQLFPDQGILVAGGREAGAELSGDLIELLSRATVPVAFEYRPVQPAEVATLRYSPVKVNASAQRGIAELVRAVGPKGPTLYTAIVPNGAELVRSAAGDGVRGFYRGARNISGHATFKVVGTGAAAATAWPVLAVAATVMALDAIESRQQKQHQDRVEQLLGRQEDARFREASAAQRTADVQLSHAIALLLDGRAADGDVRDGWRTAFRQLDQSASYLRARLGAVKDLVKDGKIDHDSLAKQGLVDADRESGSFYREVELARGAIGLAKKALLASAASSALSDPDNAFAELRKSLDRQRAHIDTTEELLTSLCELVTTVELTQGFFSSSKPAGRLRQLLIRELAEPSPVHAEPLEFVVTESGEVLQIEGRIEAEDPTPSTS